MQDRNRQLIDIDGIQTKIKRESDNLEKIWTTVRQCCPKSDKIDIKIDNFLSKRCLIIVHHPARVRLTHTREHDRTVCNREVLNACLISLVSVISPKKNFYSERQIELKVWKESRLIFENPWQLLHFAPLRDGDSDEEIDSEEFNCYFFPGFRIFYCFI